MPSSSPQLSLLVEECTNLWEVTLVNWVTYARIISLTPDLHLHHRLARLFILRPNMPNRIWHPWPQLSEPFICGYFLTCEHLNFAIYWYCIFPFRKWKGTIYLANMEIMLLLNQWSAKLYCLLSALCFCPFGGLKLDWKKMQKWPAKYFCYLISVYSTRSLNRSSPENGGVGRGTSGEDPLVGVLCGEVPHPLG